MATMTQTQLDAFLAPPRHAILATNRSGQGAPQLSPVWYVYTGGQFYISVGVNTAKVRNLRHNPAVSLCIDGGHPDARYVIIQGLATIVESGAPRQEEMRWQIIQHYHEHEEDARRYYESMRNFASVLIIVTPEKILSQDFS